MKTTFKNLLIIALFLGINTLSQGQKLKRTEGRSQIRQESHMTFDEVTRTAIEKAKINVFGTYVEQQTDMFIEDGLISYNFIGTTKVKGEWVETIGEPQISTHARKESTQFGKQDVTWVSCKIKGKVKKVMPRAMLNYKILNSPNIQSRTTSFIDQEQLYIYFKSPVDGYLSIFSEDDEGVYRLLPYDKMNPEYRNGVLVQGDIDYLFFSPSNNSFPKSVVDEMIMEINIERIEYNFIYIVFSENKYIKPSLKESFHSPERIIPNSLSKWDFGQWISNNKVSSESFQVKKQKISIQRRK